MFGCRKRCAHQFRNAYWVQTTTPAVIFSFSHPFFFRYHTSECDVHPGTRRKDMCCCNIYLRLVVSMVRLCDVHCATGFFLTLVSGIKQPCHHHTSSPALLCCVGACVPNQTRQDGAVVSATRKCAPHFLDNLCQHRLGRFAADQQEETPTQGRSIC